MAARLSRLFLAVHVLAALFLAGQIFFPSSGLPTLYNEALELKEHPLNTGPFLLSLVCAAFVLWSVMAAALGGWRANRPWVAAGVFGVLAGLAGCRAASSEEDAYHRRCFEVYCRARALRPVIQERRSLSGTF